MARPANLCFPGRGCSRAIHETSRKTLAVRRIAEKGPDLIIQADLVALDRNQVISVMFKDAFGDARIAAHGIDRNQRFRQCAALGQTFQQDGNGHGRVRFLFLALMPPLPRIIPLRKMLQQGLHPRLPFKLVQSGISLGKASLTRVWSRGQL